MSMYAPLVFFLLVCGWCFCCFGVEAFGPLFLFFVAASVSAAMVCFVRRTPAVSLSLSCTSLEPCLCVRFRGD